MGACFHIAGVTCDNCGMVDRRVIYSPNIGPRVEGDLLEAFDATPREWTAHPPAIIAEVAALRAEVARLTERLDGLDDRYIRYRVLLICPMCKARIAMLPEKASQDRLTCGSCNNSLPREAWSNE